MVSGFKFKIITLNFEHLPTPYFLFSNKTIIFTHITYKKNNMKKTYNFIAITLMTFAIFMMSCKNNMAEKVLSGKDTVKVKEVTPGMKPTPDSVLMMLKEGNERFVAGKSLDPHSDSMRIKLANVKSQTDYAYATVLSCSDSRVPVELIFDAGIMDLFVIRIAGNVCDIDEMGSIEYGLNHVKTPVLVIMGHTQCGAVTAVTKELKGEGHELERHIPPLIENIIPAAKKVIDENKNATIEEIIPKVIEENVWENMYVLFLKSPSVRNLAKTGKVKVVGAIYDLSCGKVNWLDEKRVKELIEKAGNAKDKETEPMHCKTNKNKKKCLHH
jgi:carbonic anhydrase